MRRVVSAAAAAERHCYGFISLKCRRYGCGHVECAVIITKGGERWRGIFHTLLKPCFDEFLLVDKPVRMVYHYVGRRNSSRFFYIGYCIFVSAWASCLGADNRCVFDVALFVGLARPLTPY